MNDKQRENISKLLFDLVKLTYTGIIIGGIILPKGLNLTHIILGVMLSTAFFGVGYWFTRKE
ncbi:DUF6722 family protein [uncultured Candidatus Kuenenia sp.]|uniref:DUF6722 family protein n=1 Tax=uncultured Candidatus Kuenenia sp. TaxID=1048336 RepID=UPI0025DFE573|nr:DUF6722 family protein [uncultured Candidatus Kuenenia sp.]